MNLLAVPLHLDALLLKQDQSVVNAMADFSKLPFASQVDVNSSTANISESILSQPLQGRDLILKSGLHMHWALPDALTHGIHEQNRFTFPAVPNRWLITKTTPDGASEHWIVESDYLHPPESASDSISIPFNDGHPQRFRYLGRKLRLSEWHTDNRDGDDYWEELTAIGYGEPHFAAFYPNCHSVFGFFEPLLPEPGTRFDLLGWYQQPTKDPLKVSAFVRQIQLLKEKYEQAAIKDELLFQALEEVYGWTLSDTVVNADSTTPFPDRILCFGQLEIGKEAPEDRFETSTEATVSIGNSSTEALSAFLAHELDGDSTTLEDQLEAIHLAPHLEGGTPDVSFKFREERHDKSFTPVSGGKIWTITAEKPKDADTTSPNTVEQPAHLALPERLAHQLNTLNTQQQALDQAHQQLLSLREQTFRDWYKYMLSAYPPAGDLDDYPDCDEIIDFIRKTAFRTIREHEALLEKMIPEVDALVQEIRKGLDSLTAIQASLKQVPAPRYWRPQEPVVLIHDNKLFPTHRHGEDGREHDDGLLECLLLSHSLDAEHEFSGENVLGIRETLLAALEQTGFRSNGDRIGYTHWVEQPWHPFMMEWAVEFFPKHRSATEHHQTDYPSQFVSNQYELKTNQIELSEKAEDAPRKETVSVFTGRGILLSHANDQLKFRLKAFLEKTLLPHYYEALDIKITERTNSYFDEHEHAILSWFEQHQQETKLKPVIQDFVKIYHYLNSDDYHPALTQSLSGFNRALLMQKQTFQLPIEDPLGFADYRPFTEAVADAVKKENKHAPLPLNDFHPIRAGYLKISELRIIDTFGRVKSIAPKANRILAANTIPMSSHSPLIRLKPRLMQPARLNFRWLSSNHGGGDDSDDMEMNAHPAASPICGWLLPNLLDSSLMVYDASGTPLGSIDRFANWAPPPGHAYTDLDTIQNPHLKKLVRHLVEKDAPYIQELITNLEQTLETIEPEGVVHHEAITLFFGRPMAVVRANLNFELQGSPAIHQGWNHFRHDMARFYEAEHAGQSDFQLKRDSAGFTRVKLPVRLGEYHQLQDGLVGYWIETGTGYSQNRMFTHQPNTPAHIHQSIDDPSQTLTLLMDPRGSVHATTGLLPTKALSLPYDQYSHALKQIEVTFLSAPILTGRNELSMPLPDEPGYDWSWLSKTGRTWNASKQMIPFKQKASFEQLRIVEGWLKLKKTETDNNEA